MTTPAPPVDQRRGDLDLLRVIMCFSVMLAHTLIAFAPELVYHVKDKSSSWAITALYEFFQPWMMPLFFLLSGWSAMVLLRGSRLSDFVRGRALRLGVPLLTGMILLCPIIKYFERISGIDLRMNSARFDSWSIDYPFGNFLIYYFRRINYVTWSHLWFLLYLILYLILFLPLLLQLARTARTGPARIPAWALYLPPLLFAPPLMIFHGWWPFHPTLFNDAGNFIYFGLFVLTGAAMATFPAIEQAIRREWRVLGALGTIACIATFLYRDTLLGRAVVAVAAWYSLCGMYGLVAWIAPRATPLLRYLASASLPLYVIHNLFAVIAAHFIVQTGWPMALKILAMAICVFGGSFAAYHFLIRPIPLLRFMFGLSWHRKRTAKPQPAAA